MTWYTVFHLFLTRRNCKWVSLLISNLQKRGGRWVLTAIYVYQQRDRTTVRQIHFVGFFFLNLCFTLLNIFILESWLVWWECVEGLASLWQDLEAFLRPPHALLLQFPLVFLHNHGFLYLRLVKLQDHHLIVVLHILFIQPFVCVAWDSQSNTLDMIVNSQNLIPNTLDPQD